MAFPRTPHVLVGAIAGLGSALWLSGIAPLAGLIAASWGALTIVHAFAVAVTAVLAMLVTAAGVLLAADWRADVQGRQAWSQLKFTAAELSLPVSAETPREINLRYLPAADSEALRRIFHAHRVASALPVLPAITGAAPEITCAQGINAGTVSELRIADRALRTLASTVPANASNAMASRRDLPLALRTRHAMPARLVANANAWSGWPSRDVCVLTRTGPELRSADIVVLSNGRDDQARPTLDGSEGGNIASSTEPPSCRGPPQVVGHRSRVAAMAPAKLSDKSARQATAVGALPTADPVVRDNLGRQVPVCAAELDVIETYLDHVLQDLLASSTAGSEQWEA